MGPSRDWRTEIKEQPNGLLETTWAKRTGCAVCGFGIHVEKRPHRFDWMRKRNYRECKFWMYDMGWGAVLDYIRIGWRGDVMHMQQLTMPQCGEDCDE